MPSNLPKLRLTMASVVLLFASTLYSLYLQADEEVEYQNRGYVVETPAQWVKPIPAFETVENEQHRGKNGIHFRIIDQQINDIDPQNTSYFFAYEYALTSMRGVENESTIKITFDPSYEKIVLHNLTIKRNDEVLDKLPGAKKQLIQSETDLDKLIYNGSRTLVIIPQDIRVGDIVHYEYTRKGTNPIFNSNNEFRASVRWYDRVEKLQFRLLSRADRKMHVRSTTTANLQTKIDNNIKEYSLQVNASKAKKWVDDVPSWRLNDDQVVISDFENWHDVVQWSLPLYTNAIQSTDSVKAIADNIVKKHSRERQRIGAALQWVQNEIRYFGIEFGANSHNPSMADVTLKRRFGDCKDKTTLLITLLNEMGIEAHPALVDTSLRIIDPNLPSRSTAFNHVITHIQYDGEDHWLDPTLSNQVGALGKFYEPDYGYALILKPDNHELTAMVQEKANYKFVIDKKLTVPSEEANNVAKLKVVEQRSGYSAERRRASHQNIDKEELFDRYESFYRHYFSGLSRSVDASLDFTDFPHNGNISVERYDIQRFWKPVKKGTPEVSLNTGLLATYLEIPDEAEFRQHSYLAYHPIEFTEIWRVNFSEEVKSKRFFDEVDNKYFYYSRQLVQSEDTKQLVIRQHFKSHASEVAVEDLVEYEEAVSEALYYNSTRITPQGLYSGYDNIDEDEAPDPQEELNQMQVDPSDNNEDLPLVSYEF